MSAEQAPGPQAATGADLLWAKGLPLDQAIHDFTVDEDPLLDPALLPWDVVGSTAHVRMLVRSDLMTAGDGETLCRALASLHSQALAGELRIRPEQEDGHTALEQALVQRAGPVGRRIHLGRSRNDQVILAFRLYLRDAVLTLGEQLGELAAAFSEFGGRHLEQALPGYTHMRRAMPSSVGQWALSFAEGLNEELEALEGSGGVWTAAPWERRPALASPCPSIGSTAPGCWAFARSSATQWM